MWHLFSRHCFTQNLEVRKFTKTYTTYRTIEEADEKVLEGSGASSPQSTLTPIFSRERSSGQPSLLRSCLRYVKATKKKTSHVYSFAKLFVNTCGIFSKLQMQFQWTCDLWLFIRDDMRLRHRSRSQVIGIGVISLYIFDDNWYRIVPYRKKKKIQKNGLLLPAFDDTESA